MTGWDAAENTEQVRAWMMNHPRECWAYERLNDDDELRSDVVECILTGRNEEALVHLVRFADALDHRRKSFMEGMLQPPPEIGERRPHDVWLPHMSQLRSASGSPFYRVDVRARDGWSGYFDTTVPQDIERIFKMKDRTKLVVIVGEIIKRPYDCFVVFGERTRLT